MQTGEWYCPKYITLRYRKCWNKSKMTVIRQKKFTYCASTVDLNNFSSVLTPKPALSFIHKSSSSWPYVLFDDSHPVMVIIHANSQQQYTVTVTASTLEKQPRCTHPLYIQVFHFKVRRLNTAVCGTYKVQTQIPLHIQCLSFWSRRPRRGRRRRGARKTREGRTTRTSRYMVFIHWDIHILHDGGKRYCLAVWS